MHLKQQQQQQQRKKIWNIHCGGSKMKATGAKTFPSSASNFWHRWLNSMYRYVFFSYDWTELTKSVQYVNNNSFNRIVRITFSFFLDFVTVVMYIWLKTHSSQYRFYFNWAKFYSFHFVLNRLKNNFFLGFFSQCYHSETIQHNISNTYG